MLATFFGASGVPEILSPVPCYTFPESAARALAHAVAYAGRRAAPVGLAPTFTDLDGHAARAIVEHAAATGGGWLSPLGCDALLHACGIPTAGTRVATAATEACSMARTVGFPVVLKGAGPNLLHKTEKQAVFTGLADDAAVLHAFGLLSQSADVVQILVQPMVVGVEMFVGASFDSKFGHAIVCGSGGTLVELVRDTSCRLAPLTDVAAREMLDRALDHQGPLVADGTRESGARCRGRGRRLCGRTTRGGRSQVLIVLGQIVAAPDCRHHFGKMSRSSPRL